MRACHLTISFMDVTKDSILGFILEARMDGLRTSFRMLKSAMLSHTTVKSERMKE